jgi:hypothetical protein
MDDKFLNFLADGPEASSCNRLLRFRHGRLRSRIVRGARRDEKFNIVLLRGMCVRFVRR